MLKLKSMDIYQYLLAHMITVDVQFLKGINRDQNISNICVNLSLLVPLAKLSYYHVLHCSTMTKMLVLTHLFRNTYLINALQRSKIINHVHSEQSK